MRRITLLIVDDNFVIRRGLRSLLERDDSVAILGEASTGAEAIQFVRNSPVDVILMDMRMPGINGIKATASILELKPEAKVLALTVSEDPLILAQALIAGARGYLIYGKFNSGELLNAIHAIYSGGAIITPAVAPVLLDLAKSNEAAKETKEGQDASSNRLTAREEEVLSLIAAGKENPEIAGILCLEEKTVKNYINNIYSKLHLKNRYEAISYVLKRQP